MVGDSLYKLVIDKKTVYIELKELARILAEYVANEDRAVEVAEDIEIKSEKRKKKKADGMEEVK